jgi:KDO2-lipid IV(A) lauroyltransferase
VDRGRSNARNAVEYWIARLVLASLALPPRPIAEHLARCYAGLLRLIQPRLVRIARQNLAMAGLDPEIEHAVWRSIARLMLAFARFPQINKQNVSRWIRYDGLEHFEQALQRGKGVLFATAHLGNWELSAFSHALMCSPMHIVVRPLDNPLLDRLVGQRRQLSGNRVIEKKDFARGILRALSNNEAVGILIDQNAAPEEGVFVNFFGVPACAALSFARIAAHSGAAVIPGFALWSEEQQRYVLKFYPAVEISGDAAEDTRRLHAHLEQVIREHPDQWLWIHRRWKTRPPGEPPLY